MKGSMLFLMAGLCVPAAAQAHEVPWPGDEAYLDWRLVTEGTDGSAFIADIRRVGRAASFVVMGVYRRPMKDPRFDNDEGYDAESAAGLVDCETKRFEMDEPYRTLAGKPVPPPLIRLPLPPAGADPESWNDMDSPPLQSARYQLLEIACGEAKLQAGRIEDPYRWARNDLA